MNNKLNYDNSYINPQVRTQTSTKTPQKNETKHLQQLKPRLCGINNHYNASHHIEYCSLILIILH